ncbi:MAG: hydrogen peroxide-dependent heme synthase, partial [Planctomycetota bacterium]
MNAPTGRPPTGRPRPDLPEPSVIPITGWHCSHFFYRFRREAIDQKLTSDVVEQFRRALHPDADVTPERIGTYWISGHEADFGLMVMDPDPGKVDAVHQRILAPGLGNLIEPVWSFVSMSEISEYVLSVDDFRQKMIREGIDPESPELQARVSGYERRLPMMNEQRLRPEFPDWPSVCFYPMNKRREVGANWFDEAFSHRQAMMSEHADSGIAFAGRVTQLISVGVGFDDWEWMVTLWGRNPEYLKEIVYRMRFDKASALYAEFGPFYVGYKAGA